MNTELRKKAKNDFEKDFHKLMNNAVFGKVFKKFFSNRNEENEVKMKKTIYLGFSILEISIT